MKYLVFIFISLCSFGCGTKISHINPITRTALNFENRIVYMGKFGCHYKINSFFDSLNNLAKEIITLSDGKTLQINYTYTRNNELDSVFYNVGNRELIVNYTYDYDSKFAFVRDTLFFDFSKPQKEIKLHTFEKKIDQEIFTLLELPKKTKKYHLPIIGCDDESIKILDNLYFANVQQISRPSIHTISGRRASYLFYINQNSQNNDTKSTFTYFNNDSQIYLVEKMVESNY